MTKFSIDSRRDPALVALETQIKELADRKEYLTEKIEEQMEELDGLDAREKKLRASLHAVAEIMGGNVSPVEVSEEPEIEEEPEPQPMQKRTREDWRVMLRDWVMENHRQGEFGIKDVAEAFDIPSGTARDVVEAALEYDLLDVRRKRGRGGNRYSYKRAEAKITSAPSDTAGGRQATGEHDVVTSVVRHPNKDFQAALAPAIAAGAKLTQQPNGHFKLTQTGKNPVTMSGSPSDRFAVKKLRNDLRRNRYPL